MAAAPMAIVAAAPVLVPMTVAAFPVSMATFPVAVATAMLASHGCARDRKSRNDGGNNREFSKHLLIPSALGQTGHCPREPLH
jgi:hypothetical protein